VMGSVISGCYGMYVELSVEKSRVGNTTPKRNHSTVTGLPPKPIGGAFRLNQ
jgi:hypothetical protein